MICVMKNLIGKGREGEVTGSRMRHYQKKKKSRERNVVQDTRKKIK